MEQDLRKILANLKPVEPSVELEGRVLQAIERRARWAALWRALIWFSGLLAALLLMVPAGKYLLAEWTGAHFTEFLSLLIADRAAALAVWPQYLRSLGEALPLTGLLLVGFAAWLGLTTGRLLIKNLSLIFLQFKHKKYELQF